MGAAARRPHAGLLRLPRPRARPQPDRGGHRRPLPPQLRPHRRPQGRPAQGLDRRDQGGHGQAPRLLRRDRGPARRQRDLRAPHPRHRRHPRRRRPCRTACPAPTSGPAASTGTSAATHPCGLAYDQVDWKVWTHPDGDSFARYWVRLQETREATKIVDQLLDGLPAGPIMAKVPRIIKVPAGEAWVATENPLGEMGYYVVSQGRPRPVPGQDPLGLVQQHLDRAVGAAGASTCPTSSRSWRQPLLHPGGHRPVMTRPSSRSTLPYWAATLAQGRARAGPRSPPAPSSSSTSSCSR